MATDIGVERCGEPRTDDPSQACGAVCLPGGDRCLAHAGEQAREEFLAGLAPGAAIDMRGVPFTADLLNRLLEAVRDPQADARPCFGRARFDGASFSGDARFSSTSFSGDAEFGGASFFGDVGFLRASFSGAAGFGGASFSGDVHFGGTSFSGDVRFHWASFSGDARFSSTSFSGDAHFMGASFSGDAYFGGVSFSGNADFVGARFAGDARWLSCRIGVLSLDGVVAEGEVWVEAAAGQVSARRLRSTGRVALRLRSARVNLTELVCSGPVSVHALAQPIPNVPDLDGPTRVMAISLRGVDAESLTLTDVELSECLFAGLHRADQIQLDGHCRFAPGPRGRRRVLAEEHHWRAERRTARRGDPGPWRPAPDGVEVIGPRRIEVIYRQLRKALEEGKNEPGAAHFYYGEMQMRRASARGADRALLWLYWAISGYGLRARRALAWVAVVAVLSIAGMAAFGFPQTAKTQQATGTVTTPTGPQNIRLTIQQSKPVKPLPERLEKAVEVTVNAVIFRSPDAELTTAGRYLNITVRILGPILLGLAILAIRNQVKR
ncbi:pentapeptide repeat-containing protein [Thermomonospora cellulosilytica]|uniref:Pentapeptide repeat-containing protein n=1 Tax=Thermomonospora cellulosilytica TaxID=1411118 RepID=A0A7W3N1W6_9ACTN|nr:pentapeptide repeat-containing protein [Thermomonospora cellulosilytica]MBA9005959.1 hypothetical protein [Thermomonospora cellulosilytica]